METLHAYFSHRCLPSGARQALLSPWLQPEKGSEAPLPSTHPLSCVGSWARYMGRRSRWDPRPQPWAGKGLPCCLWPPRHSLSTFPVSMCTHFQGLVC